MTTDGDTPRQSQPEERSERDLPEVSRLRRQLFLAEAREAEAEYRAGAAPRFDAAEQLLGQLHS